MNQGTALQVEKKPFPLRVSVPVANEMLREIDSRAERLGVSRSTLLTRLIQWGLDSERQKRDQLAERVKQLRETKDSSEAERLGNELGEMIFG